MEGRLGDDGHTVARGGTGGARRDVATRLPAQGGLGKRGRVSLGFLCNMSLPRLRAGFNRQRGDLYT